MARKPRRPAPDVPRRIRLVGYVRVSSEEQAAQGVSLDAQRARLAAYALAHDAELVGIEADEGVSGKLPPHRRPALLRALDLIRAGAADGVVVLKLDRLSRSTRDVLDLVDETRRHGWRLVSVSESLDTATAAGRLVVTVLAALAEMEREQVAERTRFALAHVARQGRIRSRFAPFGYRIAQGGHEAVAGNVNALEEDAAEQRILRRMISLRERRGFGARRIAGALNGAGTTNPRTGQEWHPSTVAAVLETAKRRAVVLAA